MIPGTIFDIFQPMNDFFYGLDVEIRPKLTPGAGTPRWALAAIHPGWGNRYSGHYVFSPEHTRTQRDKVLTAAIGHGKVWLKGCIQIDRAPPNSLENAS